MRIPPGEQLVLWVESAQLEVGMEVQGEWKEPLAEVALEVGVMVLAQEATPLPQRASWAQVHPQVSSAPMPPR